MKEDQHTPMAFFRTVLPSNYDIHTLNLKVNAIWDSDLLQFLILSESSMEQICQLQPCCQCTKSTAYGASLCFLGYFTVTQTWTYEGWSSSFLSAAVYNGVILFCLWEAGYGVMSDDPSIRCPMFLSHQGQKRTSSLHQPAKSKKRKWLFNRKALFGSV